MFLEPSWNCSRMKSCGWSAVACRRTRDDKIKCAFTELCSRPHSAEPPDRHEQTTDCDLQRSTARRVRTDIQAPIRASLCTSSDTVWTGCAVPVTQAANATNRERRHVSIFYYLAAAFITRCRRSRAYWGTPNRRLLSILLIIYNPAFVGYLSLLDSVKLPIRDDFTSLRWQALKNCSITSPHDIIYCKRKARQWEQTDDRVRDSHSTRNTLSLSVSVRQRRQGRTLAAQACLYKLALLEYVLANSVSDLLTASSQRGRHSLLLEAYTYRAGARTPRTPRPGGAHDPQGPHVTAGQFFYRPYSITSHT